MMRKVLAKLWILPIALLALQLAVWFVDRTPPREIGTYTATPAAPGGAVVLTINIKRDTSRRCHMSLTRDFYDSQKVRYSISDTKSYPASAANWVDVISPDKLILSFVIPPSAARGTGLLVTAAEFTCNPLHTIWPIPLVMAQSIEAL